MEQSDLEAELDSFFTCLTGLCADKLASPQSSIQLKAQLSGDSLQQLGWHLYTVPLLEKLKLQHQCRICASPIIMLLEITAETRAPKPLVCYAQDEKSTGIHSMKVECILNTSKLHFSFLFKAILSSELRTTLYSIILFDKTYKIYVLETNC